MDSLDSRIFNKPPTLSTTQPAVSTPNVDLSQYATKAYVEAATTLTSGQNISINGRAVSTVLSPSFTKVSLTSPPTQSTDAATKGYVDMALVSPVTAGTGITVSGKEISARIDNTTIVSSGSGSLSVGTIPGASVASLATSKLTGTIPTTMLTGRLQPENMPAAIDGSLITGQVSALSLPIDGTSLIVSSGQVAIGTVPASAVSGTLSTSNVPPVTNGMIVGMDAAKLTGTISLSSLPLGSSIALSSTADTSSATTGAVTVAGGLGVGKSAWIQGNLVAVGNVSCASATVGGHATNLTQVQALIAPLANTTQQTTFTATTDSTSTSTGGLVVSGGLGVGKALSVGGKASVAGQVVVTNTTPTTSKTTGALVVSGGLGTNWLTTTGQYIQSTGNASLTFTANTAGAANTGVSYIDFFNNAAKVFNLAHNAAAGYGYFEMGTGVSTSAQICSSGNVAIGVSPVGKTDKLTVAGNIACSDATATNHAVTLGQLQSSSLYSIPARFWFGLGTSSAGRTIDDNRQSMDQAVDRIEGEGASSYSAGVMPGQFVFVKAETYSVSMAGTWTQHH
ncbi:hypothetical protein AMAG_06707 [Allomyces macrogynus ATCC 38327]|uniref:Uncharacterized protein n=1 Tax=Allomyces macrogynus (strain ATCC 38327) TaxID=578462 RepID=A0A0L0SEX5_ALLM3|nr:hypothetical protein AMAG_06707 [Allomyces macrogynus ATCC 38327]|eukprot:KNE60945.1 hypothetical protein AMAG_06707 [Allomyces macrogynus ATCC 38327]